MEVRSILCLRFCEVPGTASAESAQQQEKPLAVLFKYVCHANMKWLQDARSSCLALAYAPRMCCIVSSCQTQMGRLLCTMLHNDVLSDIKLTFSRGVKRMQSLLPGNNTSAGVLESRWSWPQASLQDWAVILETLKMCQIHSCTSDNRPPPCMHSAARRQKSHVHAIPARPSSRQH